MKDEKANRRERYFWDLTGYLVVRGVLNAEDIASANVAIDTVLEQIPTRDMRTGDSRFLQGTGARWYSGQNLLNLPQPHCEPLRNLLVHPTVVSRLNWMCGPGFRLDHGPQFNNAVKGTEGLRMHGAGEPHREFVAYHHQDGESYCGGVTVTWNLTDCPAGGGGFACVPGSHKSQFRMPRSVRDSDEAEEAIIQPEIMAGDVLFFMDGAQTHGSHPWRNDHERRSILYKYAARAATRGVPSRELCEPETYWGEETVAEMSAVERAVMFGPASAPGSDEMFLEVDADGAVFLRKFSRV
jgi:ectoine hydroxylase-related dioxygenase (phytanoyl-CoA dioxygenase family)